MGIAEGARAAAAIGEARTRREQAEFEKQETMRKVAEDHRFREEARAAAGDLEAELRYAAEPMTRFMMENFEKLQNPDLEEKEYSAIMRTANVMLMQTNQAKANVLNSFMSQHAGNPYSEKLGATAWGNILKANQTGMQAMVGLHGQLTDAGTAAEQEENLEPLREATAHERRERGDVYARTDPNAPDIDAALERAITGVDGQLMTMDEPARKRAYRQYGVRDDSALRRAMIDERMEMRRQYLEGGGTGGGGDAGAGLTRPEQNPRDKLLYELEESNAHLDELYDQVTDEIDELAPGSRMGGPSPQTTSPYGPNAMDEETAARLDGLRKKERELRAARKRGREALRKHRRKAFDEDTDEALQDVLEEQRALGVGG